ncbi:helix-turn-helix domain-containing protein [Aurantibacter crassamenti]|uniref:helix-turn-helix domain-containing protein n=1 Tax=Aurantibacter crassamenti TaxID=1837375 RepID=UPI00193A2EB9|nr:helix-turn-helix domain-containing protein [Aurantibacter crassamenti]MBM1105166.1 helix-turn-helix domain-containing protein [Aurantibacter crassamenti]
MENPFERIDKRLQRIEILLEKLVDNQSENLQENNKPMNTKDLSIYLSLSVYTIYGLTHSRTIPFIKKGKRLYFEKEAIDKWLSQGRQLTNVGLNKKADEYLSRNPLR